MNILERLQRSNGVTIGELTRAIPALIAVAKAAAELQRERRNQVPCRIMVRTRSDQLDQALAALKEAR